MIEYNPKFVSAHDFNGELCLRLDLRDRNGFEYTDGDILEVEYKNKFILGYIRYFAGRFEVVCPFKAARFILGLNHDYEIVGHMLGINREMIEEQSERIYE